MIPYVVYSHTDYLDTLEIQTEYLKNYENKYLLININEIESDIFSNYKGIIYYDDSLSYPKRLLSLKELNFDYILFIHDIDIVIEKNDFIIEDIYNKMVEKNIDRVDLQFDREHVENVEKIYVNDYDFYLNRQLFGFSYNVNPSIWKLSSLLNVMTIYKDSNYRDIENDAQQYCKDNYLIYRPYNDNSYQCGYFECIYFFQFLHITHHGEYLPLSNFSRLDTKFINEWLKIVDKFNLNNNRRSFRNNV